MCRDWRVMQLQTPDPHRIRRNLRKVRDGALRYAVGVYVFAMLCMALDWGALGVGVGVALVSLLISSLVAEFILWMIEWQER